MPVRVITQYAWHGLLENVGIEMGTRRLDLDDGSLTENTRAAYPISHIPGLGTDGPAIRTTSSS